MNNRELQASHMEAKDHYYAMRERYEHADRVAKVAYKAMRDAERFLIDSMLDSGVTSFNLEDGTSVHISRHEGVSVTKNNQEEVWKFLQERGQDPQTYARESLDKWQVEAYIKQALADGEITELDIPASLNFKRRASINVRGWEGRIGNE